MTDPTVKGAPILPLEQREDLFGPGPAARKQFQDNNITSADSFLSGPGLNQGGIQFFGALNPSSQSNNDHNMKTANLKPSTTVLLQDQQKLITDLK